MKYYIKVNDAKSSERLIIELNHLIESCVWKQYYVQISIDIASHYKKSL